MNVLRRHGGKKMIERTKSCLLRYGMTARIVNFAPDFDDSLYQSLVPGFMVE